MSLFRLLPPRLGRWPALAAGLALAGSALAGDLAITVTKADGTPATDTVVQVQPLTPWSAPPTGAPVTVTQKDQRFLPYVSTVVVGGTLRLTNQDRYDHHVRSMPAGPLGNLPPAKNFEHMLEGTLSSRNAPVEMRLDSPGTITLGCHIHGSMRGHVFVSTTPWVGVTDEQGRITLRGVPEGAADLRIWHPDQLTEQAGQRLQVGAVPASLGAALNFSPRKRRAPALPPTTPSY